jgi:glucosamine-6-phosphate deaminase
LIKLFDNNTSLARAAAADDSIVLRETISARGTARIIAATGASQLLFLEALVASPNVEWSHVEMFHLDEYVGLSIEHPASFRKYLLDRFVLPSRIKKYHLLNGESDPAQACREVGDLLRSSPIDLAFVGIGENGHLAFNDPPADFQTEEPYLIVNLDDACRRQQVGEGWFNELSDVPKQAISMSIRQILKSRKILCVVPDRRKARAVKNCLEGKIIPAAPASILQTHPDVTFYFDNDSASLLSSRFLSQALRN